MKLNINDFSKNVVDYLNSLGIKEEIINEIIYNITGTDKNNIIEDVNNTYQENNQNVDICGDINNELQIIEELVDNNVDNIGVLDNLITINKSNLVVSINELFTHSDVIKQELVAALVAKGLGATTDMSFDELIVMLNGMELGIEPAGTAVASDVLSGKTFINSTGQTLTGTMTNNGSKTITPKSSNQTLGAGYYSKITIKGDANLIASNIVSGKSIFGVTGNGRQIVAEKGESTMSTKENSASLSSNSEYSLGSWGIWDYSHGGEGWGLFGYKFKYVSGDKDVSIVIKQNGSTVQTKTVSPGSTVSGTCNISDYAETYAYILSSSSQSIKYYFAATTAEANRE